jgi:hypothetical protein
MINYINIILKLNAIDRNYKFIYVTDGIEDIIKFGELEIFCTEYINSENYYKLTEDQFVMCILKLTKNSLKAYMKGL